MFGDSRAEEEAERFCTEGGGLVWFAAATAAAVLCVLGCNLRVCARVCLSACLLPRPCRYLLQLDTGGNLAAAGGQIRLDAPAAPPPHSTAAGAHVGAGARRGRGWVVVRVVRAVRGTFARKSQQHRRNADHPQCMYRQHAQVHLPTVSVPGLAVCSLLCPQAPTRPCTAWALAARCQGRPPWWMPAMLQDSSSSSRARSSHRQQFHSQGLALMAATGVAGIPASTVAAAAGPVLLLLRHDSRRLLLLLHHLLAAAGGRVRQQRWMRRCRRLHRVRASPLLLPCLRRRSMPSLLCPASTTMMCRVLSSSCQTH